MALPKWAAGTLYPPGSLVQPLSAQTPAINQPNNPSFETGTLEDWTYTTVGGAAVAAVQNSYAYSGTYGLYWPGGHGGGNEGGIEAFFQNSEQVFVTPGTQITGQCYIMYNPTSSPNGSQGRCLLYWFDEDHNQLGSPVPGTLIVGRGNNGKWRLSTVTGTAPENAVYACIGVWLTTVSGGCYADLFSWNYVQQAPSGLIYRAVQPAAGYSADTEPVWPLVNGEQVIDNEVIWEAVLTTRIVWQASPILVSGAVEPDFPESSGSFVADNTISWEAVSRRVEDPKCPNGKRVIIAASKIYGDDDDLVPYSATVNPLDWSSRDDAGYLPTNLQQYGSNPVAALGLYRGNVVPMNAEGMQVWQVDEDPAQSALLDAFPVGCEFHHSVASVSNDMFFLSSLGVRSVGIAGGATNLQAGDVGMPIDPLVQEALSIAQANEVDPLGLYNPNAGQYWLCFPEYPPSELVIQGALPDGTVGIPVEGFSYTAIGGVKPYTFELINGTELPPGLTLNLDGSINGTPTEGGEFTWQVQVTDIFLNTSSKTDTANIESEIMPPQLSGWRYYQTALADGTDYSAPGFDDSSWLEGTAPFGNLTLNTIPPSSGEMAHAYDSRFASVIATQTNYDQRVWLRRTLTLAGVPAVGIRLIGYFDNSFVLYVNGVEAYDGSTPVSSGLTTDLPASLFVAGVNSIAVMCDDDAITGVNDACYFDFLFDPLP